MSDYDNLVNENRRMAELLRRARIYLGKMNDEKYPGSFDLFTEIKQVLDPAKGAK